MATLCLVLVGCAANETTDSAAGSTGDYSSDANGDTLDPDQSDALDEVVEAGQAEIPKLIDFFEGAFSDIEIEADHPSTIVYTYTYAEQVDADYARTEIESRIAMVQAACDTTIFPEMEKAGIGHPGARYIWQNADGSEITAHTC